MHALLKRAGIKAGIEPVRPDAAAVAALVGRVADVVALEDMPQGMAVKDGSPRGRTQGVRGGGAGSGRGAGNRGRGAGAGRPAGRRGDRAGRGDRGAVRGERGARAAGQ